MNPLDIAVLVVIVLSAIFAFGRGFVREALSILAWAGAAVITIYGFNPVLLAVGPMVNNALLAQLIAGFGLFIVSLIVLTIITGFLARSVRSSALSPIDRTLGFIFGLARGVVIVCLAYLALDFFPPADRPAWIKDAKSAPLLQKGADGLRGFLPESWKIKSAALDGAIQALSPAAEAQRAMRALQTPSANATAVRPERGPNYGKGEMRQLDRLIDTQR